MIIPLSTPANVSLSSFSTWTDISVASLAGYSSAVTGVVVKVITTTSNNTFGVRKKGSTDSRVGLIIGQVNGAQLEATIGVDSSGVFQGYAGGSDLDMYVVALITEDTFFTNAIDKSQDTTTTWVDEDISSDTGGDTATYAWHEWSEAAQWILRYRKNTSTDDRRAQSGGTHNWAFTGVDGSEICEQYINNSGQDAFLIGYGNSTRMVVHTNAIDRSTSTTGSYQTVTTPHVDAIAAIYDAYNSTASAIRHALRRVGDTADFYQCPSLGAHYTVGLGPAGTCEQKIASTSADLYELAYCVGRWSYRASSYTETASTTASSINVSKATGLAANDLEVTIVAVEGDFTVTTPSGYTAATPSYNAGLGRIYTFLRKATGSEASTQSFSLSGSTYVVAVTAAYTGLGSDDFAIDAQAQSSADSDLGPNDVTGVTTTVPDTLTVAALTTVTSSGATVTNMRALRGENEALAYADALVGYVGATGVAAFSDMGTIDWAGVYVAVRADAATGGATGRYNYSTLLGIR